MARKSNKAPGDKTLTGLSWFILESARKSPESFTLHQRLYDLECNARSFLSSDSVGRIPREEAEWVFELLRDLVKAVESGDGFKAVESAFDLGMLDERLRTRALVDSTIEVGLRGQKRGMDRVEQIANERRERRAQIKARVDERRRRRGHHKTPSDTQIFNETADEFGVSITTVRRADGKK